MWCCVALRRCAAAWARRHTPVAARHARRRPRKSGARASDANAKHLEPIPRDCSGAGVAHDAILCAPPSWPCSVQLWERATRLPPSSLHLHIPHTSHKGENNRLFVATSSPGAERNHAYTCGPGTEQRALKFWGSRSSQKAAELWRPADVCKMLAIGTVYVVYCMYD